VPFARYKHLSLDLSLTRLASHLPQPANRQAPHLEARNVLSDDPPALHPCPPEKGSGFLKGNTQRFETNAEGMARADPANEGTLDPLEVREKVRLLPGLRL
jgi:hypothetical protein